MSIGVLHQHITDLAMDHVRGVDQNAFAAAFKEMRGFASISDQMGSVVCPKPRRFSPLSSDLLMHHLR